MSVKNVWYYKAWNDFKLEEDTQMNTIWQRCFEDGVISRKLCPWSAFSVTDCKTQHSRIAYFIYKLRR
jgi:hypothetical protein